MDEFLIGVIAAASWVAGLFFLRFWRDTGDRLFLIFSLAFWILGLTRLALVLYVQQDPQGGEHNLIIYWFRLAAFVLILAAIVDKNRPRKRIKAPHG